MLVTDKIDMNWNQSNKKHYIKLDYPFTKIGDKFEVYVNHLPKYSIVEVEVVCDYCKEQGIHHKFTKDYASYIRSRNVVKKDACGKCRYKKTEDCNIQKYGVTNPKKANFSEVVLEFEKRGYLLLSEEHEYKNNKDKLKFKCPNHPDLKLSARYNDMKMDNAGCKKCGVARRSRAQMIPYFEVKEYVEQHGCKLLTNEQQYQGIKNKIKIECACGEPIERDFYNYSKSNNKFCWECYVNSKRIDMHELQDLVDEHRKGYKVVSTQEDFIISYPSFKVCCDNGHEYDTTIHSVKYANWCQTCWYAHMTENQKGENSHFWKGGITLLSDYLRELLKINWRSESMKRCNYKCVITGGSFHDVHHLYSFTNIVKEVLEQLNLPVYKSIGLYPEADLKQIENRVFELHDGYGYGVCLRNDIHKLFHNLYGKENNTPNQFEEFKQRWHDGEFEICQSVQ